MLLDSDFKQALHRQRRLLVRGWLVSFMFVVVFMFICEFLSKTEPLAKDFAYPEFVRQTLWAIVIITTVFLLWSKNRFLTAQSIVRGSRIWMPDGDLEGDTPVEKGAARVIFYYISRMKTALVLAVMIAVYALILALIDTNWESKAWTLLAAILLIFFYPSHSLFDDVIDEYERQEIKRRL